LFQNQNCTILGSVHHITAKAIQGPHSRLLSVTPWEATANGKGKENVTKKEDVEDCCVISLTLWDRQNIDYPGYDVSLYCKVSQINVVAFGPTVLPVVRRALDLGCSLYDPFMALITELTALTNPQAVANTTVPPRMTLEVARHVKALIPASAKSDRDGVILLLNNIFLTTELIMSTPIPETSKIKKEPVDFVRYDITGAFRIYQRRAEASSQVVSSSAIRINLGVSSDYLATLIAIKAQPIEVGVFAETVSDIIALADANLQKSQAMTEYESPATSYKEANNNVMDLSIELEQLSVSLLTEAPIYSKVEDVKTANQLLCLNVSGFSLAMQQGGLMSSWALKVEDFEITHPSASFPPVVKMLREDGSVMKFNGRTIESKTELDMKMGDVLIFSSGETVGELNDYFDKRVLPIYRDHANFGRDTWDNLAPTPTVQAQVKPSTTSLNLAVNSLRIGLLEPAASHTGVIDGGFSIELQSVKCSVYNDVDIAVNGTEKTDRQIAALATISKFNNIYTPNIRNFSKSIVSTETVPLKLSIDSKNVGQIDEEHKIGFKIEEGLTFNLFSENISSMILIAASWVPLISRIQKTTSRIQNSESSITKATPIQPVPLLSIESHIPNLDFIFQCSSDDNNSKEKGKEKRKEAGKEAGKERGKDRGKETGKEKVIESKRKSLSKQKKKSRKLPPHVLVLSISTISATTEGRDHRQSKFTIQSFELLDKGHPRGTRALVTSNGPNTQQTSFVTMTLNQHPLDNHGSRVVKSHVIGDVSKLYVAVDRPAILGLARAISNTMDKVVQAMQKHDVPFRFPNLDDESEEPEISSSVPFHIEVKSNGISTNLLNGSHILATAQVNGIRVGMKVRDQTKSIVGAISSVSIRSGRKDKWNKMLKFDRSDSGYLENILISVDLYEKGFNKKYPDQAGVHITADISRPLITLAPPDISGLYKYCQELMPVLNPYLVNIRNQSSRITKDSSQSTEMKEVSNPIITTDLNIGSPLILIPKDIKEDDHILLDLGKISVEKDLIERNGNSFSEILISVTDMELMQKTYNDRGLEQRDERSTRLLRHFRLDVRTKIMAKGIATAETAEVEVDIDIKDDVILNITTNQIGFLTEAAQNYHEMEATGSRNRSDMRNIRDFYIERAPDPASTPSTPPSSAQPLAAFICAKFKSFNILFYEQDDYIPVGKRSLESLVKAPIRGPPPARKLGPKQAAPKMGTRVKKTPEGLQTAAKTTVEGFDEPQKPVTSEGLHVLPSVLQDKKEVVEPKPETKPEESSESETKDKENLNRDDESSISSKIDSVSKITEQKESPFSSPSMRRARLRKDSPFSSPSTPKRNVEGKRSPPVPTKYMAKKNSAKHEASQHVPSTSKPIEVYAAMAEKHVQGKQFKASTGSENVFSDASATNTKDEHKQYTMSKMQGKYTESGAKDTPKFEKQEDKYEPRRRLSFDMEDDKEKRIDQINKHSELPELVIGPTEVEDKKKHRSIQTLGKKFVKATGHAIKLTGEGAVKSAGGAVKGAEGILVSTGVPLGQHDDLESKITDTNLYTTKTEPQKTSAVTIDGNTHSIRTLSTIQILQEDLELAENAKSRSHLDEYRGVTHPLIWMSVSSLNTTVRVTANNDVDMKFTMKDICVTHPRMESYYRDMLKFVTDSKIDEKYGLVMTLKSTRNGLDTVIELRMARLSLLPSVHFFQDLAFWFVDARDTMKKAIDRWQRLTRPTSQDNTSYSQANRDSSQLKLHIVLDAPQLFIPQNCSECPVDAFAVFLGKIELDMDVSEKNKTKTNAKISLDDLAISKTRITTFKDLALIKCYRIVPLLQRGNIAVNLQGKIRDKKQFTDITVTGSLKVRFTFEHIMVVLKTVRDWAPLVRLVRKLQTYLPLPVPPVLKQSDVEEYGQKPVAQGETKISLDMHNIDFLMYDETRDLSRLNVKNLIGTVILANDTKTEIFVDDILAYSYNKSIDQWEPTLEQADIKIYLTQDPDNNKLDVKVRLCDHMVVDISPGLMTSTEYLINNLEHIGKILGNLKLAKLPKTVIDVFTFPKIRLVEDPTVKVEIMYARIENHLDQDISIMAGPTKTKLSSGAKNILTYKDPKLALKIRIPGEKKSYSVMVPLRVNKAIYTVAEHGYVVEVYDREVGSELGSREKYEKCVSVRGLNCIRSKLYYDMEIKILQNGKDRLFKLESFCQLGAQYVESQDAPFEVYFSPNSEEYDWGKWQKKNPFVTCTDKYGNIIKFIVLFREKIIPGTKRVIIEHSLEIHPAYILENTMASDIQYQFPNPNTAFEVKQGVRKHLLHPQAPNQDFTLAIKVPGFELAEPVKINMLPEDFQEVKLVSNHDRSEVVKAHLTRVPSYVAGPDCIHLVLYVRVWIVNHTGLELFYAPRQTHRLSIIKQPHVIQQQGNNPIDAYQDKNSKKEKNKDKKSKSKHIDKDSNDLKNIVYFDSLKLLISPDGKHWSREMSLGGLIPETSPHDISVGNKTHTFLVTETRGPADLWRTSIIRIFPFYLLVNNTDATYRYRLGSSEDGEIMELKPRSKVPLTFPHYHHNEQLHIRSHTDWSLSIGSYGLCKPLSVLQKGYYQVKFLGDKLRTVTYADVEISIRNDMCYIVVKEPRRALFFFNNCTPFPMIPDSRCLAESENKKLNQYIKPYQAASLYWDSPQEELEIASQEEEDEAVAVLGLYEPSEEEEEDFDRELVGLATIWVILAVRTFGCLVLAIPSFLVTCKSQGKEIVSWSW